MRLRMDHGLLATLPIIVTSYDPFLKGFEYFESICPLPLEGGPGTDPGLAGLLDLCWL